MNTMTEVKSMPARKDGSMPSVRFRPSLKFYHANPKGTGCAVKLELHPAHDQVDGSIMLWAANQMTIGSRKGPNPTFPRFDWENVICVKLDFSDLCKILQVLRGECESIEDGRGLYHTTVKATTRICMRHLIDPISGYSLELYRNLPGGESQSAHILFSAEEALGLAESIAGSMSVVSFGIPVVIPHDTSAYQSANREARNAPAA